MLWSNPVPSQQTAAALQSNQTIQPINMGPVVSAIIAHQQMQMQQQRQYEAQLSQGLQQLSQYENQQKQDDAANRALYMTQYPKDASSLQQMGGDAFDESRVPDYGGTEALKAQQVALQLQGQNANQANAQQLAPYQRAHLLSEIAASNALAQQRSAASSYDGGLKPSDARHLSLIDKDKLSAMQQELGNTLGVSSKDLPSAISNVENYQPGQTAFPAIGSHPQITDESQGGYKDNVISAVKRYQDALSSYGTQRTSSAAPVQGQAAQHGPPVGTTGVVAGQPAYWDGRGWVATQQ